MQFMHGLTRRYGWMMLALICAGCQTQSVVTVQNSVKRPPGWSGVWQMTSGWDMDRAVANGGDANLTPEYRQLRQQAFDEEHQSNLATCLPAGPNAVLRHSTLYEFVFTPGRVTMFFEDGEVRRIYTDGRVHRPLGELRESYMGDSIGRWEGDTLVVETVGFPNGELFTNYGLRATLNTRLVERIHLNAEGKLQIDNVLTDPAIFTKPYAYMRTYMQALLPLEEATCLQNTRDTGATLDLTPPPEN